MKKNKNKKAVALRYQKEKDNAPRITAKGRGKIAEKILEVAKKHGIPVHEDRDLVEVLSKLEIEKEIPPHLYKVIAEILAFIYRVNKKAAAR